MRYDFGFGGSLDNKDYDILGSAYWGPPISEDHDLQTLGQCVFF